MTHSIRDASRPPTSFGQETTERRSAASLASRSWCRAQPSAVSIEASGPVGTLAASQSRTSACKASSESERVRSIALLPRFLRRRVSAVSKGVLEHLARRVPRQHLGELDQAGGLVIGQPLAGERDDVLGADRGTGFADDDGL